MKTVAFVTCSTKPALAPDDLLAAQQLASSGVHVVAQPWDASADWTRFDLVVLRSCWNYHLHPEAFSTWIEQCYQQQVPLCNDATLVKWNMHKSYLHELQMKGVAVPPTAWLNKGVSISLTALMDRHDWSEVVVKPAVSATAFQTMRVKRTDAENHQGEFDRLLADRDVLVQQFMPEVQTSGEWSLLFFDKKFSHAVLKRPKANDFRVQNDFGGTFQKSEPPSFAISQASNLLELVDAPLLYARVDGIVSNNQFLLMELELIEPVLFLNEDGQAPARFAEAIRARLS